MNVKNYIYVVNEILASFATGTIDCIGWTRRVTSTVLESSFLELITGQRPISHDSQSSPIVPWVRSRLETGDVSSITDQRLNGDYDLNSIWKAVDVAMACASPTSCGRPTMSEVVMQLKWCLESAASRDISGSFSIQRSNSNDIGPIVFHPSTTPSSK